MLLPLTLSGVFLVSIWCLVHTYFGYPLTLAAANVIFQSQHPGQDSKWDEFPEVTLVIAAYNEEEIIAQKISNSLELEYPADKLDIVVFSDGSTDRTDEIVCRFQSRGVDLHRIEGRVGKTECQNRVVEELETDIVVFSDANSMYEPDAVKELAKSFGPGINCVVGELRYSNGSGVEGERVYWRYERYLKLLESKRGSVVTANGAIYAVRRSAYQRLSPDDISDFAEPLAIVRNGGRVIYSPDAVATEHTAQDTDSELRRRIRIITRSWHTLIRFSSLLNPLQRPTFAYRLFSHKLLRWLSPVILTLALGSNIALVVLTSTRFAVAILVGQSVFYGLAAVGGMSDKLDLPAPRAAHVPYYFVLANYGMAIGLWNFLTAQNIITWETDPRDVD